MLAFHLHSTYSKATVQFTSKYRLQALPLPDLRNTDCYKTGPHFNGQTLPLWRAGVLKRANTRTHSQFTPPAALSRFLQKQPEGYSALSGERSDLKSERHLLVGFQIPPSSQPGLTAMRALWGFAALFPCQRAMLPLPNHSMRCAAGGKRAADVSFY